MSHEILEHAGSVLNVPGRFANAHAWLHAPDSLATVAWQFGWLS